jgi:hypothetical protein
MASTLVGDFYLSAGSVSAHISRATFRSSIGKRRRCAA